MNKESILFILLLSIFQIKRIKSFDNYLIEENTYLVFLNFFTIYLKSN